MPNPANDETARFHRIVRQGTLEELRAALAGGANVNAPGHCGRTALMLAVCTLNLEKVQLLVKHGADIELTDDFNETALRTAVDVDFADGVRYLLNLGAERGYHPKYPLKERRYDGLGPATPDDLKQLLSEVPQFRPTISEVQSLEVLKLFLEAGDDLNLAPTELKRAFVGLEAEAELESTRSDYQRHKLPRFGTRNPERMDLPFWQAMIRAGCRAYDARTKLDDGPYATAEPVWCYHRFGSTLTPLDDGRYVQIGGEHEDHYDQDFCIYNDVVIHDGRGGFEIYGYPEDVFPPTDSHTATLCPDGVYIVGCLGYPIQRLPGFTPVFRLRLNTWEIEPIATTGDMPGWIYKHSARYNAARHAICITGGELYVVDEPDKPRLVPNERQYELDLSQLHWQRFD